MSRKEKAAEQGLNVGLCDVGARADVEESSVFRTFHRRQLSVRGRGQGDRKA